MSTIATTGGTGTLGRPVVALLRERGHDVRVLSRDPAQGMPVDLARGDGLAAALAWADVVVHAHNGKDASVLAGGSERAIAAGPPGAHHVLVSIVGIDDVPLGYYRAKLAQEEAVRASGAPFTIVRATQFHDLVGWLTGAAAARHVGLRSRARLQPVAVADVARAVADVAEGPPRRGTIEVAGPEVLTLSELARPRGGVPLPLPLPPRLGRALRAGALTSAAPDVRGTTTYAQWLTSTTS